jgi:hypothetical protein
MIRLFPMLAGEEAVGRPEQYFPCLTWEQANELVLC